MRAPLHTPYADGKVPFRIGLQPLELKNWLQVDDQLERQLAEKARLDRVAPEQVWMAEPDTEQAQSEVLALVLDHLQAYHADTHAVAQDYVSVAGRQVTLSGAPPLKVAGNLVQEDLVLMRRNDDGSGWRIAAASLHFPSSWSLAEKFSKPLADIHAPVPGFERGTRTAMMIDRIFDNLQVDLPVWRMNFSLYDDAELFHPGRGHGQGVSKFDDASGMTAFIRVEYQTLRKLPKSGDILFTIRIHIDPVEALLLHPDREEACHGLAKALAALDDAQLAYKGLDDGRRTDLIEQLNAMAAGFDREDVA